MSAGHTRIQWKWDDFHWNLKVIIKKEVLSLKIWSAVTSRLTCRETISLWADSVIYFCTIR